MLAVLRIRAYRRLFLAQCVALVGTGILTVALGLLAYDIAGGDAGTILGIAMMIKMVAYVFLTPFLSAMSARFDSRRVLIFSDMVRAVAALFLPFVSEAWQIYVLIFLLQCASALFTPAHQAVIPEIVEDEERYTSALTLSRMSYDTESIASPLIAAALLTVMSFNLLFIGTMVGFLLSAGIILRTRLPRIERAVDQSFMTRLIDGLRMFLRRRELRGLLGLNLALSASTSTIVVNSVVVAQGELNGDSTTLAMLLGAYGAGSFAMAIIAPRLLRRWSDYRVMGIGASFVAPLLITLASVLAFTTGERRWWFVFAIWFALGLCASTVLTLSGRLLRRFSDASSRNGIFSAYFSLSHAFLLMMYPLAGILGSRAGMPTALLILAGVSTVGLGVCAFLWRHIRHSTST